MVFKFSNLKFHSCCFFILIIWYQLSQFEEVLKNSQPDFSKSHQITKQQNLFWNTVLVKLKTVIGRICARSVMIKTNVCQMVTNTPTCMSIQNTLPRHSVVYITTWDTHHWSDNKLAYPANCFLSLSLDFLLSTCAFCLRLVIFIATKTIQYALISWT